MSPHGTATARGRACGASADAGRAARPAPGGQRGGRRRAPRRARDAGIATAGRDARSHAATRRRSGRAASNSSRSTAGTCCSTAPTTRPAPSPSPRRSTISGRSSARGPDAGRPPRWPTRTSTGSSPPSRRRLGLGHGRRDEPSERRARCQPPTSRPKWGRAPGIGNRSSSTTRRRAPTGHSRPVARSSSPDRSISSVPSRAHLVDDPCCATRAQRTRSRIRSHACRDPDADRPIDVRWGERTFVMGIVNVTPDSFSGDGLLTEPSTRSPALSTRRAGWSMTGADMLDIGGESTRPGHAGRGGRRRADRVVPVIAAIRAAIPGTPISVDTTKPAVAEAVWRRGRPRQRRLGRRGPTPRWPSWPPGTASRWWSCTTVPSPVKRLRCPARSWSTWPTPEEIEGGRRRVDLIVDPGIGFGKTPDQNVRCYATSGRCGSSAGRSSARRASRRSGGSSTCRPKTGLEATPCPRRPRGRSQVSTSSGSTMSSPTSVRLRSDAIVAAGPGAPVPASNGDRP